MKTLEIKNVSQWFGTNNVLDGINLEIDAGQIVALIGPSGCGKSTLLKAVLGTHLPKSGEIFVDGKKIEGPTRDVGIVYQDYTLYPFMTARNNVAFGLDMDQWSVWGRVFNFWNYFKARKEYLNRADTALKKMQLEKAIHRYPHQLSGGMRQRVAIAQSLIMEPKLILLDEPFGALDEAIREELQIMLLGLYQENLKAKEEGRKPPYTILIVTHQLREAIYVSDRIIGLTQHYKKFNKDGAKIIYDKAAPVFHPDDPPEKEHELFQNQIKELRSVVLEKNALKNPEEYMTYWKKQNGD